MSKIQTPQPVRGTQSLYGLHADHFNRVVKTFDEVRRLYRFRRVEVPIFEHTEVFSRSLGETTDVVSKEMYSFLDKGDESLTLRPELTAGIARAYLSEGWQRHAPLKVGTAGPAFRYERPQKGRFRQFHQVDAEIIGAGEPAADIEIIAFAHQFLSKLKVRTETILKINSLGDQESRQKWRDSLVVFFQQHSQKLSEESVIRLRSNPLRILDSKSEADIDLIRNAPRIDEFFTSTAKEFFEKVLSGLDNLGIEYEREPNLVRGLDYYRHTAFEFVTTSLGSQGTVLGGGRYDGLIESMGGPATPAVGWAAGVERLALMLSDRRSYPQTIAIIPENELSEALAQQIAFKLREEGAIVDYLFRGNSRKRLEKYQKRGATTALFVDALEGDSEVIGTLNIKHYRRFGHDTEKRIAQKLAAIFNVIQNYEVESEALFNGRRVDLVLRRKQA
jgi:histidyl-tRNA synthetase